MRKEKVKNIMENGPLPKAHSSERHSFPITSEISCGLALLMVVLGIICVFFTDLFYEKLPFFLGEIMIALGTIDTIRGIRIKEYKKRETKLTSNGIVYFLLGIVILYFKSNSYMIIGAIWGTLGLLKGSEVLNKAICAIAEKEHFLKELVEAVVELVLGILLLLEPDGNLHHHIMILGLELIITGWRHIRKTIRSEKICNKEIVCGGK